MTVRLGQPALLAHEFAALRAPLEGPALFLDPRICVDNAARIRRGLGDGLGDAAYVDLRYAVKSCPHPAVLAALARAGAGFDCASWEEIDACLAAGAAPAAISFGNTVKKKRDIERATAAGVRLLAADSPEEIRKIAALAPSASIFLRLRIDASEADYPLSAKFGAPPAQSIGLLGLAASEGLTPVGLSFHAGSQMREPRMWDHALDLADDVWRAAIAAGHRLEIINIGGGFPARYDDRPLDPGDYACAVARRVRRRFAGAWRVMVEPGRGVSAEAGALATEVILATRRDPADPLRWVYLDAGVFSGLVETIGDLVRYPIVTSRDGGSSGPCILAGPTCDSADVFYAARPRSLPLDLRGGDRVVFRNAGAYTSSYSTVGFNGFAPLSVVVAM